MKAFRILILSDEGKEVAIVSGENGEIYYANLPFNFEVPLTFDDIFEKASDNPHTMPLIQIIQTEENKFLTIGYDRIIT